MSLCVASALSIFRAFNVQSSVNLKAIAIAFGALSAVLLIALIWLGVRMRMARVSGDSSKDEGIREPLRPDRVADGGHGSVSEMPHRRSASLQQQQEL